jgi:hypothetical protein
MDALERDIITKNINNYENVQLYLSMRVYNAIKSYRNHQNSNQLKVDIISSVASLLLTEFFDE